MGDGNRKTYRSKEDKTQSISRLVLVTNFLDHVMGHDLWKVCNDYGVVVDAFILYNKSKAEYKPSAPSHPSNANERNSLGKDLDSELLVYKDPLSIAKIKVVKNESKTLWILKIEDDLFTCETPLGMTFNEFNRLSGMDNDLFTYEVGIPGLSYPSHVEQQCDDPEYCNDIDIYELRICYDENEEIYAKAVIFVNKRLVRLMDVTIEQWLDLMYGDHKIVDKKIKEEVISKWLIRTLKFCNHSTMDWYMKNALWMHWIRGDDEEVLTNKELSDLEETHMNDNDEVAEIFRIETNIFDFKTPMCKAFKEFNYLLKIDTDLLTHDIPGFKTYYKYENDDELKDEALMKRAELKESRDPCSFNVDRAGKDNEKANRDEREPMNDYGVSNSDDHLVSNNARDYANKEEEQYKKRGCKLLRNPHKIPLTCKMESFEVIKYSFRPAKEFVAIKECGYNDWMKTKDDACHAYQDIFAKMDEGCKYKAIGRYGVSAPELHKKPQRLKEQYAISMKTHTPYPLVIRNTFAKVASKWGDLVEWEDLAEKSLFYKRLCVKTKLNEIIVERFKVTVKGSVYWVHAKEMEAWDPFICNNSFESESSDDEEDADGSQSGDKVTTNNDVEGSLNQVDSGDDLKCPSGFTPSVINVEEVNEKEKRATSNEVNDHVNSTSNKFEEHVPKGKLSLNDSVCSKRVHTGGSILQLMDQLVKETKMESMELVTINMLWVNSYFDYALSSSLGNSGGANAFNSFISLASLIDLPLDGYAYTCAHKTATKMSKLDRFLISKGLLASFLFLSALCLDRNLSDHLMRLLSIDYGPTPFRLFHSWFNLDGFDKMVEDTWKSLSIVDSSDSLSEALTHFKDLLQKVPHHGIDLWIQVQIFSDHVNPVTRRTIDQLADGKLCDRNAKESWALLEDLALYDNEIQRLMEAHLAPKQPVQVNKISSSCKICSGPHDTQYCMENPEQAFVDYASSRTDEARDK
ncbi:hypothetical protein Tco_0003259 [Tanacetum coccineum]